MASTGIGIELPCVPVRGAALVATLEFPVVAAGETIGKRKTVSVGVDDELEAEDPSVDA